MLNVEQITSRLAKMPDAALQQYAAMHKNDPYIMALAVSESNRRKQVRQAAQGAQGGMEPPKVVDQALEGMTVAPFTLPEDSGIAQLPAGDMNFADGGIVAFAAGGTNRQSGAAAFEAALDAEGVRDPAERAFLKAIHAQESGGRNAAPTSNRGARGPMQILPATFKAVADEGMRIDNTSDNMRAGIRYARQGYQAAGGDPVLAGAYYYGGPGGLEKARQGVAVADPKNPNAPTTIGYGRSIAQRMTAMLPISTAFAGDQPSPAPTGLNREQLIAQIPGQNGQPVPPQPAYVEPKKGLMDYVTAPFAVGRTIAQNTLAIPAAPIAAGLSQLRSGPGMSVEEAYNAMLHSPKNPVAREQLETVGRVMDDLKLPPYIPSLTPVRGTRAPTRADLDALNRVQAPRLTGPSSTAQTAAALEKALAEAPPAPGPQLANVSPSSRPFLKVNPERLHRQLTPQQMLERAAVEQAQAEAAGLRSLANAETQAQLARLAEDRAAAAAAQGRITPQVTNIAGARAINEALPGQAARTSLAGVVGNVAGNAAELPVPEQTAVADDGSYGRVEAQRLREKSFANADAPKIDPEAKKDIVDAAKEALPGKKGRGLTGEDWLMLGLGMMSSKSPRFLSALGEAGLGAMKARQERIKAEREEESDIALSKYREAMAAQAAAQADVLKSGNTKTKLALEAANTMYDNWLNTMKANPLNAMGIDPAVANAKYNQLLQQSFASFNIPVPTGLLTGTGTPAQYTDADRALVERYAKSR